MCCLVHLRLTGSDTLEFELCPSPGWQPGAELFSSSWFHSSPEGYCNLVFCEQFPFLSVPVALFALQSTARVVTQSHGNQQQCVIQGLITDCGEGTREGLCSLQNCHMIYQSPRCTSGFPFLQSISGKTNQKETKCFLK